MCEKTQPAQVDDGQITLGQKKEIIISNEIRFVFGSGQKKK